MTRKILLIILVLMLTLSSVAFVACDKNLDPFDIRQFYGEYSRNESMDPRGHVSLEIFKLREDQSIYDTVLYVSSLSHLENNGYWYRDIVTQELVFAETSIDGLVLDEASSIVEMLGTNFQLCEEKLIATKSNTEFCYDNYFVLNIESGERIRLQLRDWNSKFTDDAYPKMDVIIGYAGVNFNPKYAPKVLNITYVDIVIGADGAEYRFTISVCAMPKQ